MKTPYHSNIHNQLCMIKKVTLEAVNVQKDKGTVGILIKDKQGEEQWVNGWLDGRTGALRKFESVYIDIFSVQKGGKTYWNFRLPSIDHLLAMVIDGGTQKPSQSDPELESLAKSVGGEVVQSDLKPEDIPF